MWRSHRQRTQPRPSSVQRSSGNGLNQFESGFLLGLNLSSEPGFPGLLLFSFPFESDLIPWSIF